jgi:hypothetical protein
MLGGVGGGVRVGDALELTDPDQPIEEPGRVVVRDGIGDAIGDEVGSDPIEVGWWSQRQS